MANLPSLRSCQTQDKLQDAGQFRRQKDCAVTVFTKRRVFIEEIDRLLLGQSWKPDPKSSRFNLVFHSPIFVHIYFCWLLEWCISSSSSIVSVS